MEKEKHIGARIFAVLIAVFLVFGAVLNIKLLETPLERWQNQEIDFAEWIQEVRSAYVSDFFGKEHFINLNGLFARWTGRTVYNEVSVLKNGMLDYESLKEVDMTSFANGVQAFDTFLNQHDISFVYVQAPNKSDLEDTLVRDGVQNFGNQNANALLRLLGEKQVTTLDLRPSITATPDMVEQYFYRTDHHWNTDGAFQAFGEILQYLSETFPEESFDLSLADTNNWKIDVYEDWFLGSRGKRVGIYFGGVDDLTVYTPDFETDMSLYIPKHRAYYSGTFEETVIRSEYLDEPNYFEENPYCVDIGGDYPLVHHVNHLAQNDLKVLLIKDSFSLPLQSFLSTAVKELDVIDPRYYTESTVAEYVAASQPDIVIMMTNPSMFSSPKYYSFGITQGEEHFLQTEQVSVASYDTFEIIAAEDKNYKNRSVATSLTFNTKYTLQFDAVDILKGNTDVVTVALYNATEDRVLNNIVFDLKQTDADQPFEWTFVTPQTGSGDLRLLVYCGRHGQTAGNQVVYRNLSLYRYQVAET